MDFDLSEEQKMIQDTISKFADEEIAPVASENDKKEEFPRDLFKKLADLGFMGTPIPEEYGGAGFDFISHAIVAEEIGRVDSSLRGTYSVQVSLVELPIFKYGSEDQKKKFLPKLTSGEWIGCFGLTEPDAGSDHCLRQDRQRCGSQRHHWLPCRKRIRRILDPGPPRQTGSPCLKHR